MCFERHWHCHSKASAITSTFVICYTVKVIISKLSLLFNMFFTVQRTLVIMTEFVTEDFGKIEFVIIKKLDMDPSKA